MKTEYIMFHHSCTSNRNEIVNFDIYKLLFIKTNSVIEFAQKCDHWCISIYVEYGFIEINLALFYC